jgi:hypothetical protein
MSGSHIIDEGKLLVRDGLPREYEFYFPNSDNSPGFMKFRFTEDWKVIRFTPVLEEPKSHLEAVFHIKNDGGIQVLFSSKYTPPGAWKSGFIHLPNEDSRCDPTFAHHEYLRLSNDIQSRIFQT